MTLKNSRTVTQASLLIFGLIFLAAIPVAKLAAFAYIPFQPSSSVSTIIEVHKGLSPNDLTRTLFSQGIISNGREFIWLGRITRRWGHVKAGEYEISSAMTPMQIFNTLTSGISVTYPVTIREGENMYEIADTLVEKKLIQSQKTFIDLCSNPDFIRSFSAFKDHPPKSLEGFLYPDTYYFNRSLSPQDMAKQMVRHFFEFWKEEQVKRSNSLGMSLLQIVTLASMIEKETGAPEERPLIGSVFYNRLQKKMRLQSDPTTIYGKWSRHEGNLTRSDLAEKNEYNTYQIAGLPVGPISNPGKEAIQAALFPVQSNFLYFVSHNDGTHEFTSTYQQHLAAVRKFQLDPKAREGKSWRDLAKRQPHKKI